MPDDFPADTAPEIGSLIAGKYQVLRHIGAGGMGSVVEAENTATGKRVAVKCMLPYIAAMPGAVQLFTREARVCTSVQHPNVVQVFDLVHDTSSVFIIMELLDGESLRAFFGRGPPGAHELIGLLVEAMRGVYAAHEQGVIHRDIKPESLSVGQWIQWECEYQNEEDRNVSQGQLTTDEMCMFRATYWPRSAEMDWCMAPGSTDLYSASRLIADGRMDGAEFLACWNASPQKIAAGSEAERFASQRCFTESCAAVAGRVNEFSAGVLDPNGVGCE
jgi:hypothetical protein